MVLTEGHETIKGLNALVLLTPLCAKRVGKLEN